MRNGKPQGDKLDWQAIVLGGLGLVLIVTMVPIAVVLLFRDLQYAIDVLAGRSW